MSRVHMPMGYAALQLFVIVALPRLASLGYFPHLDEGYYGFVAQYIGAFETSGQGFPPDLEGYQLYPLLLSPLTALPLNPVLIFRLADLFFAMLAGFFFCKMLINEAQNTKTGFLLAAIFLVGLNIPQAIDSGYKNSFAPALACLFLALNLVYDAKSQSKRWYCAGFLAALAVLLRETFAPFALLGCFALLCKRDFQALLRVIAGGIIGAITITLLAIIVRGQFWPIFSMYINSGAVYGAEAARRWPKFLANGQYALLHYWPLLALTLLLGIWDKRSGIFTGRALFWLAAALLPILEPFLKLGFLYHFSVCLPGLAGLCACCAAKIPERQPKNKVVIACVITLCLMLPQLWPQLQKLPVTLQTLNTPDWNWPENIVRESNTLAVAQEIRKNLSPAAKFSSSGFAYFLFPTSGHLPPAADTADLSRTYIKSGQNMAKFEQLLQKESPELVVVSEAIDEHSATFAPILKNYFVNNPDWKLIHIIEADNNKNYGWLGYTLFKKK